MKPYRALDPTSLFATLLGFALLLAGTENASAQLGVEMSLNNTDYVSHESVKATVKVHNRSGQDVVLPQGWLTFDVYNGSRMLSGHRGAAGGMPPFVLGAGKSITKVVSINSLYPVYDWGNYRVNASVYYPPLRNYFTSKPKRFTVTDPKPFWSESIGVSQGRNKLSSFRIYELIEHRGLKRTEIYVRLRDAKGGRIYATYSIGRYINVTKPQATIDSQNRLHVMQMAGRQIYQHSTINSEGSFLGAQYYKGGRERPTLMIDGSGIVKVKGGTVYDPAAEQRAAAAASASRGRMATDRPPGLPR